VALFEYTARNLTGERVQGVLAGHSEQAVLGELESRQLVPISIQSRAESRSLLGSRVSVRRLATTYLQLSDLLRAGVPLLRSLRLLGNRKSQPRISAVFKDLSEGVARGEDLAEAMARHPDIFPKVHIAMVRAGEKGGFLEQVVARLGQFVMGQAELRGKVIGNLVYPGVLLTAGVIVLGVIFGIFVPKFRPLFAEIPELPAVTHLVFGASSLVGRYGLWSLGAAVLLGLALWRVSRRPAVRRRLAELKTRSPVLGPLLRALAASRFCRMLGTMLANGIPMLSAMQIARDAAGNLLMEEAIDKATDAVRAGQALAGPLGESRLFSEDVIEMIAVAETANNLDEVLITIAETIEARVDRMLTTAIRLIEPVLLLMIAMVVVIVAAGLILPMTRLKAGF
jgi:general secretion pathway protein F